MVRSTRQQTLTKARLLVELHEDGDLPYLDVRSLLDPAQIFLLPLPTPPAISGLALNTRLSRLVDISWGFAWGTGVPPTDTTVVFSTDSLRFRRTARVAAQLLGDRCWVADAEGVFTSAATVVNGVETTRVQLATRY